MRPKLSNPWHGTSRGAKKLSQNVLQSCHFISQGKWYEKGVSLNYFKTNTSITEQNVKEKAKKIMSALSALKDINPAISFWYLITYLTNEGTYVVRLYLIDTIFMYYFYSRWDNDHPLHSKTGGSKWSRYRLASMQKKLVDNEAMNILISLPPIDVESSPKTFEEATEIERITRSQDSKQTWH